MTPLFTEGEGCDSEWEEGEGECNFEGDPGCTLPGVGVECDCTSEEQVRGEDGECYCENGSEYLDCWLDDEPEVCDPAFQDCCDELPDECPEPTGGNPPDPPDTTVTWSLQCDIVVRGEPGGCSLAVDPPEALESIDQWTFSSEFVWNQTNSGVNPWADTLVIGGEVIVNFTVDGETEEEQGHIVVLPRSPLAWSWLSPLAPHGIEYHEGGLANPPLPWPTNRVGILCHAIKGCAEGPSVPQDKLYVQPQNPTHGNGFIRRQVTGGPNLGAWYVESVAIDVQMASAFNPDYFSQGVERPQGCGLIESMNFFMFNQTSCGTGNPGWGGLWTPFAEEHEQRHADQADSTVARWPHLDVPLRLEGLVRSASAELNTRIESIVTQSGECVTSGVSEHQAVSGPHPLPSFRIWFWQVWEFAEWKPGDPTTGTPLNWSPNPIHPSLSCHVPL